MQRLFECERIARGQRARIWHASQVRHQRLSLRALCRQA